MSTAELENEHVRCRNDAIRLFRSTKKMGGTELSMQFLQQLENDIAVIFCLLSRLTMKIISALFIAVEILRQIFSVSC